MFEFWSNFLAQLLAGAALLVLGVYIVPPAIKKFYQKHDGSGDNIVGGKTVVINNYSENTNAAISDIPQTFSPPSTAEDIKLILKDRIGIVISKGFKGMRVHLGMVFLNNEEGPLIIKKIWIKINSKPLAFKQFFKVQPNSNLRIPDASEQLPPLVQPHEGKELFAELENSENDSIIAGKNTGIIFSQLDNDNVIEKDFEFNFDKNSADKIALNNLPYGAGAVVIEVPIEFS